MVGERLSVFRIVKERWASTALTGDGAAEHGGRWNPRGHPCVYLAESRALAALEVLVHLTPLGRSVSWRLIEVSIPSDRITAPKPSALPPDWNRPDPDRDTQDFGRGWIEARSAPMLRVPSSIIEAEYLYLLNPLHPEASQAREVESVRFSFDERL